MKTKILVKRYPRPGGVELEEQAVSRLDRGEVLVRISRAAICGTDLHLYKWDAWAARTYQLPLPLGHDFVRDVIDAAADVKNVRVGQMVVAETHIACGQCRQCRSNRRHTCLGLRLFSKLGRGCFAEMMTVPSAVLRVVPTALSVEHACIMEPLGIAVRAVIEADPRCGGLLVIGCGPLGLFAIGAAKALGAVRVLASDISDVRLDLAGRVGADVVIDARAAGLPDAVRAATDGKLVESAIDTSGNGEAIAQALESLAPGGRLVALGLPEAPVLIDIARDVVLRETSFRGLYGRLMDETWL